MGLVFFLPTAARGHSAGFACFSNVFRRFAITVYVFFAHGRLRERLAVLANTFVLQGFSTDSGPRRGLVPLRTHQREQGVLLDLLVFPRVCEVLR